MLDPKIIRENPEKIQKMLKDRVVDFDFERLVELDKKRREFIIKTDELRKKRNDVSLEIGQKKKAGQDSAPLLDTMKNVSKELEELEIIQNKTESDYARLAFTIPNLIHESVPVSMMKLEIRRLENGENLLNLTLRFKIMWIFQRVLI